MERERFGSRLGFILISAGCAIDLGNVWRFPYITGEYGGAAFLVMYLVFLVVFLLAAFVGLSPAILVICAGCFGLAYQKIRKERPQ